MRVISWEIWMWLSRTPLSFPVEQRAQLWSLGCIPAWHRTGWGVLLCAQLSWKPGRRIRVSFRSVLAPEQWLLAMWMSSDWRGTWPPGQRDFQKHEGREKNQMVLRWWVSRSITWAGFLPSHRAGQLTEKGFSIVCLDKSELLLPSSSWDYLFTKRCFLCHLTFMWLCSVWEGKMLLVQPGWKASVQPEPGFSLFPTG